MHLGRPAGSLLAAVALGVAQAAAWAPALALSTDRDEPIEIEARTAEADNRNRVTIYRGDVVITQGTLRITGDTVWVHYDDANTITKAISEGRPARFRQLPDDKPDYQTADARRMEYHADENRIVLIGNARYGEGKDKITAERIDYDARLGHAKAGPARGESGSSDRVRITITPPKNKEKTQ